MVYACFVGTHRNEAVTGAVDQIYPEQLYADDKAYVVENIFHEWKINVTALKVVYA